MIISNRVIICISSLIVSFGVIGCQAPTNQASTDTKTSVQPSVSSSPQTSQNNECNDSSSICASINKNKNIIATLPDPKNSKSITLKYNDSLTLSDKPVPSLEEICKLGEGDRVEFYHSFFFSEANGKIQLNGNTSNKIGISDIPCTDSFIDSLEFYDLGKLKITDLKNVPIPDYKQNLFVEEGHSYAVKDYSGYVDFADARVATYIYVEKIDKDGITITLNSGI